MTSEPESACKAFCVLLWVENGGELDNKRRPVVGRTDDYVRGNCLKAVDCFDCPIMQKELGTLPADEILWVCPECVTELANLAKTNSIPISIPGYYTEGNCQNPYCWKLKIDGVSRYSVLLQLFLGPIQNLVTR